MAEFQEVMKQMSRICRSVNCKKCPLNIHNNGTENLCGTLVVENPQRAEEIIMKWAEENRVQTNAEKFKEVFGVKLLDDLCNNISCDVKCDECDLHIFCQQEYKEPKGE